MRTQRNIRRRGEILTIVLIVLGLTGAGALIFKPKFLHGESKRADASKQASANVETTTATADSAAAAQAAAAAAYVVKIGEANSTAPASKEKDFINAAVPIGLSFLPKPDPAKLLEAEKLKNAFLLGQLELANTLVGKALTDSAVLQHQRDVALAERDAAMMQRREADAAISEAAAAHLAMERQQNIAIAAIVLLGLLVAYIKLTHLSPAALGKVATDIRNGEDAINALGLHTPPWIHDAVQRVVKLKANLDKPAAVPPAP